MKLLFAKEMVGFDWLAIKKDWVKLSNVLKSSPSENNGKVPKHNYNPALGGRSHDFVFSIRHICMFYSWSKSPQVGNNLTCMAAYTWKTHTSLTINFKCNCQAWERKAAKRPIPLTVTSLTARAFIRLSFHYNQAAQQHVINLRCVTNTKSPKCCA